MATKKSKDAPAGRKFRRLEKGTIVKWEKGLIVEGILDEIREGTSDLFAQKGHLVDIKTAEKGLITYSCPTILYNYLKQLDKGAFVRIECMGKIKAKRGRAWDFIVDEAINEDEVEE